MHGRYKLDRFVKFAFLPLSFRTSTLFFCLTFFSSSLDLSTLSQFETNKNSTNEQVETEDSSQGTQEKKNEVL